MKQLFASNFFEKPCSLGLARQFDTKLHKSRSFWSIYMKFSGLMCLGITNICGNFRYKQSTRTVIALAYVFVNPHPAHSIKWRIYASISTPCIWTYDVYMRQSATNMLKKTCRCAMDKAHQWFYTCSALVTPGFVDMCCQEREPRLEVTRFGYFSKPGLSFMIRFGQPTWVYMRVCAISYLAWQHLVATTGFRVVCYSRGNITWTAIQPSYFFDKFLVVIIQKSCCSHLKFSLLSCILWFFINSICSLFQ